VHRHRPRAAGPARRLSSARTSPTRTPTPRPGAHGAGPPGPGPGCRRRPRCAGPARRPRRWPGRRRAPRPGPRQRRARGGRPGGSTRTTQGRRDFPEDVPRPRRTRARPRTRHRRGLDTKHTCPYLGVAHAVPRSEFRTLDSPEPRQGRRVARSAAQRAPTGTTGEPQKSGTSSPSLSMAASRHGGRAWSSVCPGRGSTTGAAGRRPRRRSVTPG
jgi:hypothetical protein